MTLESSKRSNFTICIMWVISIVMNIKSVFTNFEFDTTYAFAMSYRQLQGDDLFGKMREPHQTSAFIITFLTKVYMQIFKSNEGIVVFANIVGMLVFGGVAVLLVKLLKRFCSNTVSNILGAVFFLIRPKWILALEYSNMLILFSTLLFITLAFLLTKPNVDQRKFFPSRESILVYLSAFFLCLTILSYPSSIVLYIVVSVLLFLYSDNKWMNYIRLTGFCAVFGICYFIHILNGRAVSELIAILLSIFKGDTHSSGSIYSGIYYWIGTGIIIASLLVSVALALIVTKIVKDKSIFITIMSISYIILITMVKCCLNIWGDYYQVGTWSMPFAFLLLPIILGVVNVKKTDSDGQKIYFIGMAIGAAVFIAVLILTNLPIQTIFGYICLCSIVSFIPLESKISKHNKVLAICLLLVGVAGVKYVDPTSINYIRKGPLKYMIAPIEQCNEYKISYDEWNANVFENDAVLIPKTYQFDATYYTYTKASVSAASTISTPYYGEYLKDYWLEYPDKEPTVIAVSSWDGNEKLDVPEWLISKIENEYELSSECTYWHFYRKK